jgi:hypothetical protein
MKRNLEWMKLRTMKLRLKCFANSPEFFSKLISGLDSVV